jgi:CheY-like chemotaxis protein
MAHLLSFVDTRPQSEVADPPDPPNPSAPPLPQSKDVKASPRKALLVENDASLLNMLRASLTNEGYEVSAASNGEEGLRLYQDCAPFNVVFIDYYVPQRKSDRIDCLAQQTKGTALASEILKSNPSQGIIIAAFDYRNAGEIKLEGELKHIPLLLDASTSHLRRVLEIIEVHRAMDALTPDELEGLQKFAYLLIRGLGRAASGRTDEDLLGHAMMRTLIGAGSTRDGRHWNKHVDFVWHLTGAMRGISSNWKRQYNEKERQPYRMKEPHLMSEHLKCDADGQELSPVYNREAGRISSSGSWKRDLRTDERLIEQNEEDRVLA